jgi:hypothetical protein
MVGKISCVGKSDEGLFEHTFSTTISTSYLSRVLHNMYSISLASVLVCSCYCLPNFVTILGVDK